MSESRSQLNRTALVTGSTDGIGVAIARTLAAGGVEVIVSGRNAERGEQVVQSILDGGGEARFAASDLSTGDGVRALAAAAGPVDILVNNAAMLIAPQPSTDVPRTSSIRRWRPTSKPFSCSPAGWRPQWPTAAAGRSSTWDRSTASSGWHIPLSTARRRRRSTR
jgi:NAD(P)-dependent dehydrogenase (short-subunit alcohol dehydrogenase family)